MSHKLMLIKSTVKRHTRTTKTGKVVNIREHITSRTKKVDPRQVIKKRQYEQREKVAEVIRSQIGNRTFTMLGAKQYVKSTNLKGEHSISFRIGKNVKGVSIVRVTLRKNDTYDVEYGKAVRGAQYKEVSRENGIQAENLNDSIERNTGMATSLGTMGAGRSPKQKPKRKVVDRFDIPAHISNMMEIGRKAGMLDDKEMYAMGSKYGNDWQGMADALIESAYSNVHSPKGAALHSKIVKEYDKYNAEVFKKKHNM